MMTTDQRYDFQVSDEKIVEKKLKYFLSQDTVRLSCTSSSSRPPATLSWILNDQKVINCKLIPKKWWQWWHRILSNILTFDGSGYCTLYYILDSCQLSIVHHHNRSEVAGLWTEKDLFWDLTPIFVFLFPILQAEKCSVENANFRFMCFAMFMS